VTLLKEAVLLRVILRSEEGQHNHVSLNSASQADQRSKRSAGNQYIANALQHAAYETVQPWSPAPADISSGGTRFIAPDIHEAKSTNTCQYAS
jgi:hypothetical protein